MDIRISRDIETDIVSLSVDAGSLTTRLYMTAAEARDLADALDSALNAKRGTELDPQTVNRDLEIL